MTRKCAFLSGVALNRMKRWQRRAGEAAFVRFVAFCCQPSICTGCKSPLPPVPALADRKLFVRCGFHTPRAWRRFFETCALWQRAAKVAMTGHATRVSQGRRVNGLPLARAKVLRYVKASRATLLPAPFHATRVSRGRASEAKLTKVEPKAAPRPSPQPRVPACCSKRGTVS
jgi:hypothetical protein